ncbi:endothelin-converting enzyme 1-like [Amblyomma americanum]|uniref:Peptidase M13 N-terminal domain-containing protein n=1 Tax=Amblyomma americanum TaxID=6943 RepID=A0AAQ4FLD7_AMBAM
MADAKKHRTPFFCCYLLATSAVIAVGTAVCVTAIQILLARSAGPCTTDACRHDRDRLASVVDPSKAPCDDFYGFVCGGATSRPSGGTVLREVEMANLMRLNDSLIAYAGSKNAHAFRKLTTFYVSCYTAYREKHDLRATVHSFLRNLGVSVKVWLRAKNLEDLMDQVAYLSLHRNIPSFLWIRTEPSGLVFLQPALPFSRRLNAPVYEDIQRLLHDFVSVFDEITSQEERIFDLHVIHVRLQAVQITEEGLVVRVRQAFSFLSHKNMSLWLSAINKYLPKNSQLAPDSLMAIRNADLLGNLTRSLQASHWEVRNLYVLMTLLEAVVEWEYTRFRLVGLSNAAFETVYYCTSMSRSLMTKLWTAFVAHTLVNREQSARGIRDVVSVVTERFKDDFAAVAWQGETAKARTLQWLSVVRWNIPDERAFDTEVARESLAHVPEMGGSYFLNVGYLRLRASADAVDDGDQYAAEKPVVAYDFNRNTLTVTVGALVKPLYYSGAELYINVVSLGSLVAYQLWNAVVTHKPWARQPRSLYLWVLEQEAGCYVRSYRNVSEEAGSPDAFLKLELYSRVRALRTSLDASSGSLDMQIKKPAPEWPDVTQLQFFFIRYCSMMCSRQFFGLHHSLFCDIPVSSTVQFKRAFQCSRRDTLGSVDTCDVS